MSAENRAEHSRSFLLVRTLFTRATLVASTIGALVSAATTLLAVQTFIRAQTERIVEARLRPYLDLTNGLNLNQTQDWEEALDVLQPLITSADTSRLSANARNQLADAFIYAAANGERPRRHRIAFRRAVERLSNAAPETGWRSTQMAWYHLRVGHQDSAELHFRRAIQLYESESQWGLSSDPVRGLVYAELAKGSADRAFEMAQEAEARDAASMTVLRQDLRHLPRERWYAEMRGYYGVRFDSATQRLKKIVGDRPAIP